ncbi:MAG: hypothetical protein EOR04_25890 [Mesorhizobium sp.]|uniref:hypothetical protein n=1 Tax=Mesorhizobium sp. TaxID=1871066 RepID=UPI000FE8DD9D|nr:hypothetical protein [Mesorhizobium sp.]RWP38520.1 MAG: hypothetical protein EOR04_25890 [Mesorhizobium sp.]
MTIDKNAANLLNALLRELSSELDLHYTEGDFAAISPTLDVMREAADAVRNAGFSVPDAYEHIVRRSNQALSSQKSSR